MLTYSKALATLQNLTGIVSTDAANSATLLQYWNDSRRTVAGINGGKWPWLEIEGQALTVAGQEYVEIPNNIRRVITVRQQNGVDTGSVIYPIRMFFDQLRWDKILAQLLGSSDVPYCCIQRNERLYIQPVPSSDGNIIFMRGRVKIIDLSLPDHTTGTVIGATNGGTTLQGSSTAWTAGMAGQYIRLETNENLQRGDNAWYQIDSVSAADSLELVKPYQGTDIALGNVTYTIGQITYEPETYQMAPIYRAVAQWWDFKEDMTLSQRYWRLYDGGVEAGLSKDYGGLIGQMLEESNESMEGSYMSPLPRSGDQIGNGAIYWFPWDDATGF